MEAAQNHLETWAVVELMGHQKEVGFVTTQYYGAACMFKIDVPDLPEKEKALTRATWIEGKHVLPGTVVKQAAQPGRTRLVGVSSVYAMNPCDRETAISVLEETSSREMQIVSLAGARQLSLPGEDEPDEQDEDDEELEHTY